jgi:hypothetical protein
MAIDLSRVRDTSATARRFENIHAIINKLREGEMTRVDIQALLKFSPSGARKYCREMISAGVMVISHIEEIKQHAVRGKDQQVQHFRLTDDEEIIANVLALIVKESNNKEKVDKPKERVTTGDTSRHFHIMSDDTYYAVKVPHKKIPAHTELMAAFYGMGSAQVEA